MEGFKKPAKMQCFKEGGSVKYESRKEHKEEMSTDIAQDKAMIKKGVKQHESALHKGEPKTELKLKTGGRAKKSSGTVKKYKTGGTVENQYAAKKTDKDIKDIANTKRQKPQMLCGGKSVKKYADGGSILDTIGQGAVSLKEKIMGTPEQNRLALEREKRIRERKAAEASGNEALIKAQPSPTAPLPSAPGINAGAGNPAAGAQSPAIPGGMKKGGKAKGKC